MQRHPDVELLASERIHQGHVFDVLRETVRLPSGLRQQVDVVEHAGAVCVAAVTDEGELLLVRQYRHPVGDWIVEIPAGRLEPGDDDPLAAAQRELEEETGHRAARWERACTFFPAPGFCSELHTLFVARGLEPVPGGGLAADDDEEIEVVRAAPAELFAGGTRDAKTLIAAAWLLLGR